MKRLVSILALAMASAFAAGAGVDNIDHHTTVTATSSRDVGWD